jgi:uncharacterized protein YbbC (DUF1343 family)
VIIRTLLDLWKDLTEYFGDKFVLVDEESISTCSHFETNKMINMCMPHMHFTREVVSPVKQELESFGEKLRSYQIICSDIMYIQSKHRLT